MITTYKYWTKNKQRLAIRANKVDDNIEIIVLRCSKKDLFSRKFARVALNLLESAGEVNLYGQVLHPERTTIPCTGEFAKTFFSWCKDNYYKRHLIAIVSHKITFEK